MIAPHIRRRFPERLDDCRVGRLFCRRELLLADKHIFRREIDLVDELRVMHDGLVAVLAHIIDDHAHELGGTHVLAEQLLVAFANLRIELDLVECRLREQALDLAFPDFLCLDDSHYCSSLSNTCRKSSTI